MRSLLTSLLVLSIGILAALPFRKSSMPESERPRLDHSQMASLVSPLEELGESASASKPLALSEVPYIVDDHSYSTDYSGESPQLPALPKSRRPFADGLVRPKPMIADRGSPPTSDPPEIANRSRDWSLDLPLKYVQPQTGLEVEAIAKSPGDSLEHASGDSNRQTSSPAEKSAAPSGMFMQPAGSKFNTDTPAAADTQPGQNPPVQRKRHFVYEPAG